MPETAAIVDDRELTAFICAQTGMPEVQIPAVEHQRSDLETLFLEHANADIKFSGIELEEERERIRHNVNQILGRAAGF